MTRTTADTSALFGTDEFFKRDNYAPVADELTHFDLPVEGAIPAELNGWYLRNGPNPRQAGAHWFTGDGMIHGVRLEGGRAAWYRNRWVRTDSFEKDFPLYNADGSRNLRSAVANTHVVNHAGKTLALVESSLPYEITNDLETVGAYDFGGKLVDSMTAHPKICPTTGELHFFGYGSIFEPYVTYHRADANGELTINRPLEVGAHTMMHDFALTAEHVVFMDLPIVFNLDIALKGESDMPYRWDDTYGARLGVMRRDDPFGPVRWFEIDPCYVFHVANAFGRPQPAARPSCYRRSATPNCGVTAVDSTPTACCGAGPSTCSPARSASARSTTARWSSPASTTGWPPCPPATRSRSAPTSWSATTSQRDPRWSMPSAPRRHLVARVRRCSYPRRPGRPTRAAAGTSATSTTRPATAATW